MAENGWRSHKPFLATRIFSHHYSKVLTYLVLFVMQFSSKITSHISHIFCFYVVLHICIVEYVVWCGASYLCFLYVDIGKSVTADTRRVFCDQLVAPRFVEHFGHDPIKRLMAHGMAPYMMFVSLYTYVWHLYMVSIYIFIHKRKSADSIDATRNKKEIVF